jgi:ABC-type lipoprotein export system ATPase subunit
MSESSVDVIDSPSRSTLAVARPLCKELAIRAEGVGYWYGEGEARTQVLFDNTMEIGRGEVVILTGPSGSGKTTLLTLIGALRRMQQGSLCVLDHDASALNEHGAVELRKNIGFIFQSHNLFSSLTAMENVRMATALRPASVAAMNERAARLLEQLGLGERLDYLPAQLSGGQRQRVSIAQQFMCSEHLLLMDEPFSGLDLLAEESVCKLIREMALTDELKTFVLVTHDVEAAVSVADTIWLLGRDRDAQGSIIPGARIQATYNLVERGLAWREDGLNSPEYLELLREIRSVFPTL